MNYQGEARTNYVSITNIKGLTKALKRWPLEVRKSKIEKGKVALFDTSGDGWPSFAIDDNGEDIEFDVATLIMPFVSEGEVLVVMEAGHEGERYVIGNASAWVRRGKKVLRTFLCLEDIYARAARKFSVKVDSIARARC